MRRLIIMLIATICVSFSQRVIGDEASNRIQALKDFVQSAKPIDVYGKVVDDAGAVVTNADVELHWLHWTVVVLNQVTTRVHLTTDSDGRFHQQVPGDSTRIFIGGITRTGYDFPPGGSDQIGTTSYDDPFVVCVRKMNEGTFVMRKRGDSVLAELSDRAYFSLGHH